MSNTYKGYELAEAVDNGLFSLEQRVNGAGYFYCTIGFILKEVGTNFLFKDFEIIEEQQDIDIQSIEELNDTNFDCEHMAEDEVDYYHNNTRTKMNEIIQAVKQLDKKMEEKNNGIK